MISSPSSFFCRPNRFICPASGITRCSPDAEMILFSPSVRYTPEISSDSMLLNLVMISSASIM